MSQNSTTDRLTTFAFNPTELEFLNSDAYSIASGMTSLRDIDYWYSRSTNNAQYTENLLQEEFRIMHPRYDRVAQFENSSVEVETSNGSSKTHLTSSAVPASLPHKESEWQILVQSILIRFELNVHKESLLKVLSYYLSITGLNIDHPALNVHLNHFNSIKFPVIADLNAYVGTRYLADEVRKIFKGLVGDFLGHVE